MKVARQILLLLGILLSWSALATSSPGQPVSVTLMTLNVQNLFDNLDDPGKDDKAYLPIAAKQNKAHRDECSRISNRNWRSECLHLDWSDAALDHKMSVLAKVIRQVNAGEGPDVVALQEVENEYILERLRTEYLDGLGYQKSILLEGKDRRGIDVAFLSKLPMVEGPVLHPLTITTHRERAGDTRGILEARFQMPDGSTLTGYVVHFPAPFHPTEMRVAAYEHLQSLRDALPDNALAFAAGDFNTTSTEDARERLLDKLVRPDWEVAHDYCDGCRGTYYYAPEDNWSFLDMILVSGTRGDNASWQIAPGSVHIANDVPEQVTEKGTPARYRSETREGASDHWPLVLTLQPR
ncbi:MAG: endonuclease/exonuclease/phosphatase family protein [Pseudomonadales bacterium]|jgi:endonuclease/exonuclease/phosphatase family metal-dependent hydrolase|nr:endonuclease/exonuclease/phosphatase family protein [Pseudomonadales bacterium]